MEIEVKVKWNMCFVSFALRGVVLLPLILLPRILSSKKSLPY